MGRMRHRHFSEEECLSYSPVPPSAVWPSFVKKLATSFPLQCHIKMPRFLSSQFILKANGVGRKYHQKRLSSIEKTDGRIWRKKCSHSSAQPIQELKMMSQSSERSATHWTIKHVKQHWYTFRDHYYHLKEITSHCVYPHLPFMPLSHSSVPTEVKRQKSVPEDLRKVEEDGGSPTDLNIRRPFEEEVRLGFFFVFLRWC